MLPTFTHLLMITALSSPYPYLVLPMADSDSCHANRIVIEHHLKDDAMVHCYNLLKQGYDD